MTFLVLTQYRHVTDGQTDRRTRCSRKDWHKHSVARVKQTLMTLLLLMTVPATKCDLVMLNKHFNFTLLLHQKYTFQQIPSVFSEKDTLIGWSVTQTFFSSCLQ